MPAKIQLVTEQHIRNTPLPAHGKRYKAIPHGYIIDETRKELTKAGFQISQELYKTTFDGQIAQGVYHLNYGTDKDMGLMFAWSNSYNKMMRFKCAVGAQVFICMNGVVSGDLANYKRKHTGSALVDVTNAIQLQISHAKEYYDNLVADKEMLKQINLDRATQASVIGRLLIEQEVLSISQVSVVQRELDKPTFQYSNNPNSAWDLYNHITLALKDSHPLSYLNDHQKVHNFFVNEFGQLQNVYAPVEETEEEEEILEADKQEVMESLEALASYGVVFN